MFPEAPLISIRSKGLFILFADELDHIPARSRDTGDSTSGLNPLTRHIETFVDKYFVFFYDGRTCVIVPVFPSNHRGEV
jgi:hypothetical protein